MTDLLIEFVKVNPRIASFILTVGGLRLVLKPLMTGLHNMAKESQNLAMDEFLIHIERSKLYKIFVWILDYLASVKL